MEAYLGEKMNNKIEKYQIYEVIPGLFVGDYLSASQLWLLKKHSIKTTISCTDGHPPTHKLDGCEYRIYDVEDGSEKISDSEITCIVTDIIDSMNRGSVLCTCFAGQSRSVSFVALAVAVILDIGIDKAVDMAYRSRVAANIHPRLLNRIYKYYYDVIIKEQTE